MARCIFCSNLRSGVFFLRLFASLVRKQITEIKGEGMIAGQFCSYSTTTTFIHSRSSLKNLNRFQIKMGKISKSMPVFRTKRHTNPSLWGGTCLYSLYKGVLPGARGSSFMPPRALPAAYYATSSSTIYQSLDEVRLEFSACYPALEHTLHFL